MRQKEKLYLKDKKGDEETFASRTFQKTDTLDQEF